MTVGAFQGGVTCSNVPLSMEAVICDSGLIPPLEGHGVESSRSEGSIDGPNSLTRPIETRRAALGDRYN